MESTVVEVLILNGFGKIGFYKIVTGMGLKILRDFEGPRGGGAWLAGHRQVKCPTTAKNIAHYYYLSRINCKPFIWCKLGNRMMSSRHRIHCAGTISSCPLRPPVGYAQTPKQKTPRHNDS